MAVHVVEVFHKITGRRTQMSESALAVFTNYVRVPEPPLPPPGPFDPYPQYVTDAELEDALEGVGGPGGAAPDASTTTRGLIELATVTETRAGTDAVRAVTPAGLQAVRDDLPNDTALRAALVPRPAGGSNGQALVKQGDDIVWAAIGGGSAGPLTYVTPSGDTTGATDSAAIASALTAGHVVLVGDFITNAPIRMPSHRTLILWNATVTLAPFSNCQVLRNSEMNATGNKHIRVVGIGRASLVGQIGAEIVSDAAAGTTSVVLEHAVPVGTYRIGATSSSASSYETVQVTACTTSAPYTATLAAPLASARLAGRKLYNQARQGNLSNNVCVFFVNAEDVLVENVSVGPGNAFACLTQVCRRVIWRNIRLNQDHSATNQDGIDIGAGCRDILIDGVTGMTGDDFCSIYAQNTSGSLHAYPKSLTAAERDIAGVTVRRVKVDVGINVFRIQAGDGSKFSGLRATDIENTHVGGSTTGSAIAAIQLGQTEYVTTQPAVGDLSDVVLDGFKGNCAYLVAADSTFDGIVVRNAYLTTLCSGLRFTGLQIGSGFRPNGRNVTFENIVAAAGMGVIAGLASAQGISVTSAQTLAGLVLRNIFCATLGSILHNECTCTGVVIDNISIGTATAALVRSTVADVGSMSDVHVGSWGTTQRWAGARTRLKLAGDVPEVATAATAPLPTRGSQVTAAAGVDLTGGTATTSGLYVGDGTGWNRIVAFADAPAGADTTAPTVAWANPASGATVSGTTILSGSYSDDVGVTRVQVLLDGNNLGDATLSNGSWSYSWTTTAASNASHTLSARAYDAAGNAATATRDVTVSNAAPANPPGTPTITATGGASKVTIAGSATDATSYKIHRGTSSGAIGSKTLLASGVALPYVDSTVTAGTPYYYQAVASNSVGDSGPSAEVSATPTAASNFVNDTMTAADGTALAGHAAETGGTWVSDTNAMTITAGRAYNAQAGASRHRLPATPNSADYTVLADVTFASLPTGSVFNAPVARATASGGGYQCRYLPSVGGFRLDRVSGGSTAASIGSVYPFTPTAGQTVPDCGVRVTGSLIEGIVNGQVVCSGTDATITAAGNVGVFASGAATSTTGHHIDNVRAF